MNINNQKKMEHPSITRIKQEERRNNLYKRKEKNTREREQFLKQLREDELIIEQIEKIINMDVIRCNQ